MASATLQDDPSVGTFSNVAETGTLALFEHLSFEFLEEFDVHPVCTGANTIARATRDDAWLPPLLLQGHLRDSSG
jgi:hypothetical protein